MNGDPLFSDRLEDLCREMDRQSALDHLFKKFGRRVGFTTPYSEPNQDWPKRNSFSRNKYRKRRFAS